MGSSQTIVLALLTVGALALSGCSGGSGAKPQSTTSSVPASAPPAEKDPDTCAIVGLVVDEEFAPVQEAQVGLLKLPEKKVYSAADGRFTFSKLPPDAYDVAASKPGYEPDVKRVECNAAEEASVTLELTKIPDPIQGYRVVYNVERGHLGCAFGYLTLTTGDLCKALGIDTNGKTRFTYKADAGVPITGGVYEAEWTPTGSFGAQYLTLSIPKMSAKKPQVTVGPDNKWQPPFDLSGKHPLRMRAEAVDASDPLYSFSPQNNTMSFDIKPSGSQLNPDIMNDGSSKLIFSQDFDVYVAVFYAMEPVPSDFSMLP